MKTQSIKSTATLLGVAAVLNMSALAGPGPQTQYQTRKVTEPKTATIALYQVPKSPATGKSAIEPQRTPTQVSGPHGVTYTYRSTDALGL